jgi:hypothetical protein
VQVVDALLRHFVSFEGDARVMPLIWHISLLVFVQRYKHQLTTADRDALAHLTTVQHHYKVGRSLVAVDEVILRSFEWTDGIAACRLCFD